MSALTVQNAIVSKFRSNAALDAEFSATLTGTVTSLTTAVTGVGTAFTTELKVGDYIGDITHGYRKVTVITDDTHLTIESAFLSEYAAGATKRSDINKGMSDKLNLTEIGKTLRVVLLMTADVNGMAAGSRVLVGYGFVLALGFYEPDIEKTDERISFYDTLLRNAVDVDPTFGNVCEGITDMETFDVGENFDAEGVYEGNLPLMCYKMETRGAR